jgi:hypothetical protein
MGSKQFAALIGVTIQLSSFAQELTLVQRVEQLNDNIEMVFIADGPRVTLPQMLASTRIVVRGVIGEGVSHLTPDGQSITTTYTITNPTVLFSATPPQVTAPGVMPRAVTITLPGGTLQVGRFSATVRYTDGPKLTRGMNVIALLQNRKGTDIPAGGAGVFEVRQGRIAALSTRTGAHQQFSGMVVDDFVSQIVTMRKNVQKK